MKKLILVFILSILLFNNYLCGQFTIQYRVPGQVLANFQTQNIWSDFGRRTGTGNISRWHRGTDLNLAGTVDYGNHIISPVNGIVSYFHATSYKIIVIEGLNSNGAVNQYNFGYGHIFNDNT